MKNCNVSAKDLLFLKKLLIIIIVALASEQAARQQAESNAAATAAARNIAALDSQLIPKPRGLAGDGYCLIEEMGLENEKLCYNAVIVSFYFFIILYLSYFFLLSRLRYTSCVTAQASIGSAHICGRAKRN